MGNIPVFSRAETIPCGSRHPAAAITLQPFKKLRFRGYTVTALFINDLSGYTLVTRGYRITHDFSQWAEP
jgi:hypothetical protein